MNIKCCASAAVPTHTTFNACPVDDRPCVVLEPLHGKMVEELGREGAESIAGDARKHGLPCGSCRKGQQDAHNLSGLRLGKHERRILLAAPPGSKCGWRAGSGDAPFPGWGKIIYPDSPSRSAEESNRRALRKLEHAGLVELESEWASGYDDKPPSWFKAKRARSRYWRMGRKYRTARLTPLGELVVDRCRQELEAGKPIRWQKFLSGLIEDVVRSRGELFRQFGLWFGGVVFWAGFGAGFGRTEGIREQSEKRREAAKRLQQSVLELARKKDGAA